MTAPCYICGKKSVIDGLCATCYDEGHPLIEISTPLTLLACKKCGAIKVPGGWRKVSSRYESPEELADYQIDIVLQNEIKYLVDDVSISLEEIRKLDRVTHLVIQAIGKSHEKLPLHEEKYPVEIRFSYGTCDTCGMLSGGYYEVTLQIRADGRELNDTERRDIEKLVTNMTVAKYTSDDKAFVTSMTEDKYGLDILIGSENLGKTIADELEARYLAERKENYKLIGEDKTGKRKYRITILIRLPRFSVGDFVLVDERPCQILAMTRNNLTCFDLKSRARFTMNPQSARWRTLQFLTPQSESREFMIVTHVYGQPVQIMDSTNFVITYVDEDLFEGEINTGSKIFGVVFEDRLYLLPTQNQNNENEV
ncbi:MAG: hypothetical protein JW779_00515 [Candidatus Thorarchaeota archaeon]|nr:hypothetical protein [Candidatus Thorarchaeota archaeon]